MFNLIQNTDWTILHWIHNTLQCNFLDFIMPKITILGNAGSIWVVAILVLLISKKYRKYGIILICALAIGLIINNMWLKPFVARSRPCWIEHVKLLIKMPKDFSFPSGHTLSSVIGAFILTAANRKFGYFAIPIAILIIFSRLYLYVHFPSDVFVSVILGLIISTFVLLFFKKTFHLSKKKYNF